MESQDNGRPPTPQPFLPALPTHQGDDHSGRKGRRHGDANAGDGRLGLQRGYRAARRGAADKVGMASRTPLPCFFFLLFLPSGGLVKIYSLISPHFHIKQLFFVSVLEQSGTSTCLPASAYTIGRQGKRE